jgi:hypothetical protein
MNASHADMAKLANAVDLKSTVERLAGSSPAIRTMPTPQMKKFKTHDNRYGPGKVHKFYYDSLNKLWHCACLPVGKEYYGVIVDDDTEVTCKSCLSN